MGISDGFETGEKFGGKEIEPWSIAVFVREEFSFDGVPVGRKAEHLAARIGDDETQRGEHGRKVEEKSSAER